MDSSHLIDWWHDHAAPSAAFQQSLCAGIRAIEDQVCHRKWIVEVLLVAISGMSSMMLLTDVTGVALDKLLLLAENDFSKVVVVHHDIDIPELTLAALLPVVLLCISRKLQLAFQASRSSVSVRDDAGDGKRYEAR